MKRKPIKTKISEIVTYWSIRVDESELSIDWADGENRCWRCATETNHLERAHIIPMSLGGKDIPENFVVLCHTCHVEGPNFTDSDIMWDWLRAYRVSLYDTFWLNEAFVEYERIYKTPWLDDLRESKKKDEVLLEIIALKNHSIKHFGAGRINRATQAGILRMLVKSEVGKGTREGLNDRRVLEGILGVSFE